MYKLACNYPNAPAVQIPRFFAVKAFPMPYRGVFVFSPISYSASVLQYFMCFRTPRRAFARRRASREDTISCSRRLTKVLD